MQQCRQFINCKGDDIHFHYKYFVFVSARVCIIRFRIYALLRRADNMRER